MSDERRYQLPVLTESEYLTLLDVLGWAKDQSITDRERIRISDLKRKLHEKEGDV